jgi:hypothetical protein
MKAYGGLNVLIQVFLTSALVGGEWSASRSDRFIPREGAPGIHWIGGRVVPRTCLDDVEKRKLLTLPGIELLPLRRPARSQSLYRLSYPGSIQNFHTDFIICINRNMTLILIDGNRSI